MSNQKKSESIDFLLANICHLHRARIIQCIEALGLYQGQPHLLRELWMQEGLTQTEIAARLKISPATTTKMLQRMERTGFISRKPDDNDMRITRVHLTEHGRNIQSEVEKIFRAIEAETFANLKEDELTLLRRLFLRIRENLLIVTGEEPWH